MKTVFSEPLAVGVSITIFLLTRFAGLFEGESLAWAFSVLVLGLGLASIIMQNILSEICKNASGLVDRMHFRSLDSGPGAFRILGWILILVGAAPWLGSLW